MQYPKYPIPAAAGLIQENDQILLVKRGVEPSKGKWSLPGGKIELGENVKEALRREIKEELQIEVKVHDLLAVKDYIERNEAGNIKWHYILLDYYCTRVGGSPKATSDAQDAQWVPKDEILEMELTQTTRELLKGM